ncbi:MAG: sigma-70 family RNA polymerase sigma factor [Arachnia sp.]
MGKIQVDYDVFPISSCEVSYRVSEERIQDVNAPSDELFRQLYDSTSRRVYAYLRRHADHDMAESVLAEAYVQAWRHLASLDKDPMGWLIVTAKRILVDHHRAQQRRDRLADEVFAVSRGRHPEAMANSVVNRQVLLDALRRLSDEEREALLMIGWDGLDHTNAAKVAGCSTAAFTKRLSRARQRLTQLIEASTAAPALRPVPRRV